MFEKHDIVFEISHKLNTFDPTLKPLTSSSFCYQCFSADHVIIATIHPPHRYPAKFGCFTLFPLSVWKEIVFHARQPCEQQTDTFSNKTSLSQ